MKTVTNGTELVAAMTLAEKDLENDMAEGLKKISTEAFRDLVRISAKDSGYLRSNWSVVIDQEAPDKELNNPGGEFSDAPVPSIKAEFDSEITIYNNTEYAIYLESGTPKMRAQPMVTPVAIRADNQVKSLAAALSRKKSKV